MYQALLFPSPREARASPYAGKRGTGDEAKAEVEQPEIHLLALCSSSVEDQTALIGTVKRVEYK